MFAETDRDAAHEARVLPTDTAAANAWADLALAHPGECLNDDHVAAMPSNEAQAELCAQALKEACYRAWSTEPARVPQGAAAMALWVTRWPSTAGVGAHAHWVDGIAAIVEGRMHDAVVALDAAADTFAVMGKAHAVAETFVPKTVALSMLGRDDDAIACAVCALAVFNSVGDVRAAAKVELNLGSIELRQERYAQAASRFRSAGVRFARVRDREHSIMADVSLANALVLQGEFEEARRISERARMRARTHGYQVLVAHAEGAIGQIELIRGSHPEALAALVEASRLLQASGASPQRVLEADLSLGQAYAALNLLPEAVALYERIARSAGLLEAPIERAWAQLEQARAEARMGVREGVSERLAAARAYFEQSDNQPHLALCDLTSAELALAQGDGALALAHAQGAADVLATGGLRSWQVDAERLVALAFLKQGHTEQARQRLEHALLKCTDLLDAEAACRAVLGRVDLALGNDDEAARHFNWVLDRVDELRPQMPGDDFRAGLGWYAQAAHDGDVEVSVRSGDPERVLQAMERGRGRALALAQRACERRANFDPAIEALQERLTWARTRWREAASEGDNDELTERTSEVQSLEHELLETSRRLQVQRSDAAAAPHNSPLALDLASLQHALGSTTAVVVFHRDDSGWTASVVTGASLHVVSHVSPGLSERLRAMAFQLEAVRFLRVGDGKTGPAQALARHAELLKKRARQHLQGLYDDVWRPLAERVAGAERIVVIPHRDLHAVPFAALHDGRRCLVEQSEWVQAPSVNAWLANHLKAPVALHRVAAFGIGGKDLPHVGGELDMLASVYPGEVHIWREQEASLRALQAAAPTADVLHLACHGQFRSDNPEFSLLQLSDLACTPRDVRALPLRAGLVVLSACESGLGRLVAGDESFGLVRAFTVAGARQVLATRWPVDDAASEQLMTHFYYALGGGWSPSRSLRSAQLAAIAADVHPFEWASHVLHV